MFLIVKGRVADVSSVEGRYPAAPSGRMVLEPPAVVMTSVMREGSDPATKPRRCRGKDTNAEAICSLSSWPIIWMHVAGPALQLIIGPEFEKQLEYAATSGSASVAGYFLSMRDRNGSID